MAGFRINSRANLLRNELPILVRALDVAQCERLLRSPILEVNVGDLAPPVDLGSLRKQAFDLTHCRDPHAPSLLVSREATLPREWHGLAIDIAAAHVGEDTPDETIQIPVKIVASSARHLALGGRYALRVRAPAVTGRAP